MTLTIGVWCVLVRLFSMHPTIRDLPWSELGGVICLYAYRHGILTHAIWIVGCIALYVSLSIAFCSAIFSLCSHMNVFPYRGTPDQFERSPKTENHPRPLLFPGQTTHTRLFPKKHSFSYSYLLVGIPVGWRSQVNTFVSADLQSKPVDRSHNHKAWFHVNAEDHLERGGHVDGLRGKLDDFLEAQVRSAYL